MATGGPPEGPERAPREPQIGPRWFEMAPEWLEGGMIVKACGPDASKTCRRGPQDARGDPRWPPKGPKTAPKRAPGGPRGGQDEAKTASCSYRGRKRK